MTTAFVLSGGGSLGAVQVGMLQALVAAGVRPDMVVGTSVGAVNGAAFAARPDREGADALAAIWQGLRREDVFPLGIAGLMGALGRGDHLVSPAGLQRLVRNRLGDARLEDLPIPVHVVATDLGSGNAVRLSRGPAVEAVMASAAIPGIFPPVVLEGRSLSDGGVVDNTPVSQAVELGADRIFVLPAGFACALRGHPASALAVALQALSLMLNRRLAQDVRRLRTSVDLRVAPPLCPLDVSPGDFSRGPELLRRAREATSRWLESPGDGPDGLHLLEPHDHPPMTSGPEGANGHGR
jgi:NTE family protein